MNSLQDLAVELTKHGVYCELNANVSSVVWGGRQFRCYFRDADRQ